MKKILIALLLAASVVTFADCPDCGANRKPQIIFRCKKCKKNFCDECAAKFPGWNEFMAMANNSMPNDGTVECECGATAELEADFMNVSCKGDIRVLRFIKKN